MGFDSAFDVKKAYFHGCRGNYKNSQRNDLGIILEYKLCAETQQADLRGFMCYQRNRAVVDGEVKYVGICEKYLTTLRDRMKRYKSMAGAGTNERIVGKIKNRLEAGNGVKIYALKNNREYRYKDLRLDFIKGLENPLIRKLKPEWNIR